MAYMFRVFNNFLQVDDGETFTAINIRQIVKATAAMYDEELAWILIDVPEVRFSYKSTSRELCDWVVSAIAAGEKTEWRCAAFYHDSAAADADLTGDKLFLDVELEINGSNFGACDFKFDVDENQLSLTVPVESIVSFKNLQF